MSNPLYVSLGFTKVEVANIGKAYGFVANLAKAAKEVGSFGAQMGRLASELQQTREAAGNGNRDKA